jgi:hypothetical protein
MRFAVHVGVARQSSPREFAISSFGIYSAQRRIEECSGSVFSLDNKASRQQGGAPGERNVL